MLASESARQLLGFFRKGDAEDPDTYVAGIAALLSRYPIDVARSVTGPFGLSSKSKFLPTLSEVRDACEAAMKPRYEAMSREAERKRVEALFAERRGYDEVRGAVTEASEARVSEIAAEFRVDAAQLHARQTAEEQTRRERMRARLDEINRSICTVETPGGIMISPWLRKYLDDKIASREARTNPDHDARSR